MSPWIVTTDALEPFRVNGPVQDVAVLDYLKYSDSGSFDINLEAAIQPEKGVEKVICKTNYRYMYWNVFQQLAHHTSNGCNIKVGDVYASAEYRTHLANVMAKRALIMKAAERAAG